MQGFTQDFTKDFATDFTRNFTKNFTKGFANDSPKGFTNYYKTYFMKDFNKNVPRALRVTRGRASTRCLPNFRNLWVKRRKIWFWFIGTEWMDERCILEFMLASLQFPDPISIIPIRRPGLSIYKRARSPSLRKDEQMDGIGWI